MCVENTALYTAVYGTIEGMKGFLLKVAVGVFFLYVLPFGVFAQEYGAGKDSIQGYLVLILEFINFTIIPLLFTFALLFFLVNATRYFIIEAGDSDGRDKAKRLALYGISAFVILVSIWGIVNMFVYGLGIDGSDSKCPDYLGDWCDKDGYEYYGTGSDDYYYYPDEDAPPSSFNLFD